MGLQCRASTVYCTSRNMMRRPFPLYSAGPPGDVAARSPAQGPVPDGACDSAEFEICSIFRFDPGLPVDGATYMLWLPFVTAIASGSISLRSDDFVFGGMQVAGGRTRSVSS